MDPVLLYDGTCRFCAALVQWLRPRLVTHVELVPWQRADLVSLGVDREQARAFVWWIDGDGHRLRGHRAAARALTWCRKPWPRVGRMLGWTWLGPLAALGYRLVSAIRHVLPGREPPCRGRES